MQPVDECSPKAKFVVTQKMEATAGARNSALDKTKKSAVMTVKTEDNIQETEITAGAWNSALNITQGSAATTAETGDNVQVRGTESRDSSRPNDIVEESR